MTGTWNPRTEEERDFVISLLKVAYMQGVYDTVNQSKKKVYLEDLVPPVLSSVSEVYAENH